MEADLGNNLTVVELSDLMEICQGGPYVGNLAIDGIGFGSRKFLNKFVETEDSVFVSEFTRGFFKSGFRLLCVNRSDMSEYVLIKYGEYIEPKSLSNGKLFYRENTFSDSERSLPVTVARA